MVGRRVNGWFSQRPVWQLRVFSLVLVALLGVVDLLTGYEISFSVFFLAPIALSAWYTSAVWTLVVCLVSALTWMSVDLLAGARYSSDWIPVWNMGVRLGFFLVTMSLLTTLKRHLEIEARYSRTDPLTGLSNVRAFNEWLSHHIDMTKRQRNSFALGFIDLDDFKSVNDRFGHSTGDHLLRVVGAVLQSAIRRTDVVGRVGGDEFALLLPGVGLQGAEALFSKLHGELSAKMQEMNWPVGFSIGVAVFTTPPRSEDHALSVADQLMYSVKRAEKNRVVFEVVRGEDQPVS